MIDNHQSGKQEISLISLKLILTNMINNFTDLKQGYQILSQYEQHYHFYIHLLQISLSTNDPNIRPNIQKLASSSLLIFLRKNWSDDIYITFNERKEIMKTLINSIGIYYSNYFIKNYISKLIGIIIAKEYPDSYIDLFDIILKNLSLTTDNEIIDMLLRIILSILTECDDRIGIIAKEVIPVILQVFENSNYNQKNREKCLYILFNLYLKLTHAEGTDEELLNNTLGAYDNMNNCFKLFCSILSTKPNMLFDLKRMVIKIIDLLLTDMPKYYIDFTQETVENCLNTVINQLLYYTEEFILNSKLVYSQEDMDIIQTENHAYIRGYESDNDEKYGLEGLIVELLNILNDSLSNSKAIEFLQQYYYHLMLIIKSYSLLTYSSINLCKRDANEYIIEEYSNESNNDNDYKEERPLTIRSQCIQLLKSISLIIEPGLLLLFIKTTINELIQGVNRNIYHEIIKLSQYPNIIEKYYHYLANTQNLSIQFNESNLFIIGSLSKEITSLIFNELISLNDIKIFINGLFTIISNTTDLNYIIIGRAIWCIKQLSYYVFIDNIVFIKEINHKIILTMLSQSKSQKVDIGIMILYSQTLFTLASILKNKTDKEGLCLDQSTIDQLCSCLFSLFHKTSDRTFDIPLKAVIALSYIDQSLSSYIQINYYQQIISLYLNNLKNPLINDSFINLFKLWSNTSTTINKVFSLFLQLFAKSVKALYPKIYQSNSQNYSINITLIIKETNNEILLSSIMTIINILINSNHVLIDYQTNEPMILMSMLLITHIMLNSEDLSLIQSSSLFLSSLLILFKGRLSIERSSLHGSMILKLIMKLLEPNQTEKVYIYIEHIITLFYMNNEHQIPSEIIKKNMFILYKTESSIIAQYIIIVIAKLIIKYPNETLKFLSSFTIDKENVSALSVLLHKWLLFQEIFYNDYVKGLTIKALCILFEMKMSLIENILVSGYNKLGDTVNSPSKILFILSNYLNTKNKVNVENKIEEEMCLNAVQDSKCDYNIRVNKLYLYIILIGLLN